jgi:hypothetical protein
MAERYCSSSVFCCCLVERGSAHAGWRARTPGGL